MDTMRLERMERGCLKQRISRVWGASLGSSCCITSRNVKHAVHEPVFVPTGYDRPVNVQEDVFRRFHRSLAGLPSQHRRRLCARRRENMAAEAGDLHGVPPHCRPTAVTWKPGRTSRVRDGRVGEREDSKLSPPYFCFEQMGEEAETEERGIAMKKKKVTLSEDKRTKKKLLSNSYGFTSSSSEESDKDEAEVFFGSDETETLLSSRSFSSDSSEFYYSSSCRCSRKKKNTSQQRRRQQKPREEEEEESRNCGTWVDELRPLVSVPSSSSSFSYLSGTAKSHEEMAGEVMEAAGTTGFAVEKQSSDPQEDFRTSMLEMIMERQVFGDRDLENLLLRYLSLNSRRHHPIILEVFSEIRATLFGH